MDTLFLVAAGLNKPSDRELRELEEYDQLPRNSYLEDELNARLMDERYLLSAVPWYRKLLYKFLPTDVALVMEAWLVHHRYDVVLSYYERVGLPFAYLQKTLGSDTPHVLLTTWLSSNQKVWFFRRVHKTLAKIITWSSVQRTFAIETIGVESEKIKLVKRGTDQKFWRPLDRETDMICSAGKEMRDYPTLVEALRPLREVRCHIATGEGRGELFETEKKLFAMEDGLPPHITVGPKSHTELRELYARSRIVVVPLLPTDTDNGLTVILEAMAMGKAVICSRVQGQVDVIQDGVTGKLVPQGDPKALREVIVHLLNNPHKAEEMGRAARRYVEKVHNLEQFVEGIREEVYRAAGLKSSAKWIEVERQEV
jgi:glycosyltransferase involved in cell wall biosynthesis